MERHIKPEAGYKDIDCDGTIRLQTAQTREFLQQLDFSGEIVHTPGHSDDSMTLVLDSGEAFTGDLPVIFMEEQNKLLYQSLQLNQGCKNVR